ncbi:hypothetical protein JYT28_01225 [Desulfobulbus sp. AH-315-M07]|nr:hypothetical protein [Desulfobulbus sp. AH-315-M07]
MSKMMRDQQIFAVTVTLLTIACGDTHSLDDDTDAGGASVVSTGAGSSGGRFLQRQRHTTRNRWRSGPRGECGSRRSRR